MTRTRALIQTIICSGALIALFKYEPMITGNDMPIFSMLGAGYILLSALICAFPRLGWFLLGTAWGASGTGRRGRYY